MAIIGILGTPYNTVEQSPFWWNKVSYTRQSFIDVFQELGHTVIILPVDKTENIKNYLTLVDKIVLTGGADVSPYLYGEEPNAKLGTTDPIRDRFELATIKAALEANKPILGRMSWPTVTQCLFWRNALSRLESNFKSDKTSPKSNTTRNSNSSY